MAGELGDIIIDTHNLDYEYREQEGCLETLAGLATLYRKCEHLIAEGKAPALGRELKNGLLDFDMIERAISEDRAVEAVYDETRNLSYWVAYLTAGTGKHWNGLTTM